MKAGKWHLGKVWMLPHVLMTCDQTPLFISWRAKMLGPLAWKLFGTRPEMCQVS